MEDEPEPFQFDPSPTLRRLTPIPSQILTLFNKDKPFHITLDTGATVSFIKQSYALAHAIPIKPNNQLALLADDKTRMASLGEIDTQLTRGPITARLRALVMENLQADCFGGTTFHYDNDVQSRIKSRQIKLHNRYVIQQTNEHLPLPHSLNNLTLLSGRPGHSFLQFNRLSAVLPGENISIQFKDNLLPSPDIVTIQPLDNKQFWPPQICPVVNNNVIYSNETTKPLVADKNSKFLCLPATLGHIPLEQQPTINKPKGQPQITTNPELIIKNNTNSKLITPNQSSLLEDIHKKYSRVFNSDICKPYNGAAGKFQVALNFKTEQKPESKVCAVPIYNHKTADLQQQVMDSLEEQGVLVDPSDHDVQVRKLSPSFILQKARAKHKKLEDCNIDEIRWVVGFNSLNDDLLPKPSRPTSGRNVLTFLAKHKFHIHADLFNSYFQIPVRKRDWQWLGVRTPFKGTKVLTRSGQGLLNSETELDELVAKVLGNELQQGICHVERDDIIIGGSSTSEAINNWEIILSKLHESNLKLSPKKVKIFPEDIEVFGHRIKNGEVLPSDHIITSLGKTSVDNLKTAKQINSWKGLYKTLLSSLPNLAMFMDPFDKATAGKSPRDTITWTPQLLSSYNLAMSHLDKVSKLTLPRPEEQLILMPDGARVPGGIGWALFVQRIIDGKPSLFPVQFYSAKIKEYMCKWLPCEIEGVASSMAINACSHWILASTRPTYVTPDCKAVVEAVERMRHGKLSRNPRLQAILISINRRPVIFLHSSAKTGQHTIADHASRLDITCGSKDCVVERFLEQIPDNIQCMSQSVQEFSDLFKDSEPCIIAATAPEIIDLLANQNQLPLGNTDLWKSIQNSDKDLSQVQELLSTGDSPRKNSSRMVKTVFRHANLKDGLLVVTENDKALFKEINRIVIPKSKINSILSIIHLKGNHPSKFQSEKIFIRYFFSPGLKEVLDNFYDQCFLCQSTKKIPSQPIPYRSPDPPQGPGSHMNADVIKRAKQLILVNIDAFSNYMTTTIIRSERASDLEQGLIQVITPIMLSPTVSVRVDAAPGLKSLASKQSTALHDLGINLDIGEPTNKNSNCHVDKAIQELELEISKLAPQMSTITSLQLAKATSIVNNKLRHHGISAKEILFKRDNITNKPINVDDRLIFEENKSNAVSNQTKQDRLCKTPAQNIQTGDIVFLKDNPAKHTTREPFIVSNNSGSKTSIQKLLNPINNKTCKASNKIYKVHQHRLFKSESNIYTNLAPNNSRAPSTGIIPWEPTKSQADSDSEGEPESIEDITNDTPPNPPFANPDNIDEEALQLERLEALPFHGIDNVIAPIHVAHANEIEPYILQRQIFERQLMLARMHPREDAPYEQHIKADRQALMAIKNRQDNIDPIIEVHDPDNVQADLPPRPAKLRAKQKITGIPQMDGAISSDLTDSSPDESINIDAIRQVLSPTGLDPLNEDEPFHFFETTFSCPDLLFANSFDVFVVGPRSRADSISESDLPSSLARRLQSQTDPNFLDQ